MPRIRDEHHQRGGSGLPTPSSNGSGPPKHVSLDPANHATLDPVAPIRPKATLAIKLVRYGLPVAILLAGIIIVAVVPGTAGEEGVVTMVGICLCVALFNSLVRLGVSGDRDRDIEQAARDQYERTGTWPDDPRPGS
jgi:hypothetical protein